MRYLFPFLFQRCKKVQFFITTGNGKFYSNGLDQTFLKTCATEKYLETFNLLNKTLIRFLTFPVLTVAALNGTVVLPYEVFVLSMTTGGSNFNNCCSGRTANFFPGLYQNYCQSCKNWRWWIRRFEKFTGKLKMTYCDIFRR